MRFSFRTIFLFVSILLLNQNLFSQPPVTERPRLVIGIIVNGLQQKHFDMLWNYLNPTGFKRIIERGANCINVSYNIVSTGNAADIANVMTGTTPYYNGIAGTNYFKRSTRKIYSILDDENQVGIGTKMTFSTHNLLSSTLLDELMLAYPNK